MTRYQNVTYYIIVTSEDAIKKNLEKYTANC